LAQLKGRQIKISKTTSKERGKERKRRWIEMDRK
jgi:hypothetical protein